VAVSQVLLADTVTRLRAPLISSGYGNQTYDWPNATSTAFPVHWSTKATTEVVGDEPQTVVRAKVFGGPDLDLEATDRVVGPDGDTYEVDGEVMLSYRLGQLHHIRAFLRRVTTS
jgi:hypothetical protein